jgi:hypothetical protein
MFRALSKIRAMYTRFGRAYRFFYCSFRNLRRHFGHFGFDYELVINQAGPPFLLTDLRNLGELLLLIVQLFNLLKYRVIVLLQKEGGILLCIPIEYTILLLPERKLAVAAAGGQLVEARRVRIEHVPPYRRQGLLARQVVDVV